MPPINDPTSTEPKPPAVDPKPPAAEPKASAAEGRKPKASASATAQPAKPDLFAFTIDAANGRIVTLERVDAVGARHDLSADERARIAKAQASATVRRLVEQAFEAGIECVLGEGAENDGEESKADGELSRMLLQSLIERSSAKHLIEGEVLNRAIIGTLIGRAATSGSAATH